MFTDLERFNRFVSVISMTDLSMQVALVSWKSPIACLCACMAPVRSIKTFGLGPPKSPCFSNHINLHMHTKSHEKQKWTEASNIYYMESLLVRMASMSRRIGCDEVNCMHTDEATCVTEPGGAAERQLRSPEWPLLVRFSSAKSKCLRICLPHLVSHGTPHRMGGIHLLKSTLSSCQKRRFASASHHKIKRFPLLALAKQWLHIYFVRLRLSTRFTLHKTYTIKRGSFGIWRNRQVKTAKVMYSPSIVTPS